MSEKYFIKLQINCRKVEGTEWKFSQPKDENVLSEGNDLKTGRWGKVRNKSQINRPKHWKWNDLKINPTILSKIDANRSRGKLTQNWQRNRPDIAQISGRKLSQVVFRAVS